MLTLDPHMPCGNCFRWEGVWWLGDDGVIFECDDAFDGRLGGRGGGPVGDYSTFSVQGPLPYAPSPTLLHQ